MKIGPVVFGKDGGPDSSVDVLMFEIKSLFSVGLLRFKDGSREAFHSHAFDCWSILLNGALTETFFAPTEYIEHKPGDFIVTRRRELHKVYSFGTSYALTFRGPWAKTWFDVVQDDFGSWIVDRLSNGRRCLDTSVFSTRLGASMYVRKQYDNDLV